MQKNNEKKKIEIVSGNGKDLDISAVHNHLPISKPKKINKNDKGIIIPAEKKNTKNS